MREIGLRTILFYVVYCLKSPQIVNAKDTSQAIPQQYIQRWMTLSRFTLLLLTSFLYLMSPSNSITTVKIAVVAVIALEALAAVMLYHDNREPNFICVLAVNETLGIIWLIVVTGGLDSPFVWYALNPIIVAAVFLPIIYSWCGMIIFLTVAVSASSIKLQTDNPVLFNIQHHLHIILIFFFVTLLYQLCAQFFSCLAKAYAKLSENYELTEAYLLYISSFEQALEAFSSQQDRTDLAAVLSNYAAILCGCPAACMLARAENDGSERKGVCIKLGEKNNAIPSQIWEMELKRLWQTDLVWKGLWSRRVEGIEGEMVSVPIKSCGEAFGLLVCASIRENNKDHVAKWLQLMAELGAITLDRIKSDELWGRLLVSEEQNRIANEIHDGVAQYLFGMVCALNKLSKENAHVQDESIQAQLKLVQVTAQKAARELRTSIYGLSPYKRGESVFVDSIASFLDKLGRLNDVRVDLFTEGSEDVLDSFRCKSLDRIIREAASNAVRHGRCHSLAVRLWMSSGTTVLEVEDDGCGYDVDIGRNPQRIQGLGLRNIQQIVSCFDGQVKITSEAKTCTLLRCTIPGRYIQRDDDLKGGKVFEVSSH